MHISQLGYLVLFKKNVDIMVPESTPSLLSNHLEALILYGLSLDTVAQVQILNKTVFCIVLICLGKICIQLFSLQLWVNSRADWYSKLGIATSLGENKIYIQTPLKKIDLVLYPACDGVLGKYLLNKLKNVFKMQRDFISISVCIMVFTQCGLHQLYTLNWWHLRPLHF